MSETPAPYGENKISATPINQLSDLSEKVQRAAKQRSAARTDMIGIRDTLLCAQRTGVGIDDPEGTVTVHISHTLAEKWATSIDRLLAVT
jgi:hypothetical protein